MNFEPTIESAMIADKAGQMRQWIEAFLNAEGGNKELLDIILGRDFMYAGPADYALADLPAVMGPNADFKFVELPEKWERRVYEMLGEIKLGWQPAPLIATDYWHEGFEISDGAHRKEALLRSGITSYPVIFLCRDQASYERIASLNKAKS